MSVFISKAYDEGMRDALEGRDYSNPYIPPQGADETFDWKPDHEESYHLGYEANQFIENYKGIRIHYAEGDGFHASNGPDHFGYCDTLAEITAEIEEYFASDTDPENIYGLASVAQSIAEDTHR